MSVLKLKPCPFCGGEPEVNVKGAIALVRCNLDSCDVNPRVYSIGDGGVAAVEAWNRRET